MALKRKIATSKDYLTPQQLEYFREQLLQLRHELEEKAKKHLCRIQEESLHESDSIDRAAAATNHFLEVQARGQEQQLIAKVDQALERIDSGTYGFCEETGAPIGLARLEAYPTATLCLEIQNLFERFKKNPQPKRF